MTMRWSILAALMGVSCGEPAPAPRTIERALGPLSAALTSVAIDRAGVMWIVGGEGLLARRAVGATTFEPIALGSEVPVALWSVTAATDVGALVVGDAGSAFAVAGDAVTRLPTDTDVPLRDVVGASARAHVVGGPPATLLVVGAGRAPESVPLPADVPRDVALLGAALGPDGALHVVGERGVRLVVRDGVAVSSPVPGGPRLVDLQSVDAGGALVAVGGNDQGYAVELDEDHARRVAPDFAPPLTGVSTAQRRTIAVGLVGTALELDRAADVWRPIAGLDAGFDPLAVVVDADGVIWIAGGRALDGSLSNGALWRIGPGPADRFTSTPLDADAGADADADAAPEHPETDTTPACPNLPEATELELGERVLGCFVPYVDGGDARVVNGPQGGSHVELAVRFPAAAVAATRVHLRARLTVDGTTAARFELDALPTEIEPGAPATRVTTDVPVIFAGADPSPWLGRVGALEVTLDGGRSTLTRAIVVTIVR